jgi:MFS transporter, PAT family, solute carrier family 33 (acetyl-CoA transportor), member 1
MTGLELLERGVTKDTFALLAIPLTPLEILLPLFITKYTSGKKPLNLYAKSHPFR